MIVKVSKRGWSFKGAGLYYLNPKRSRDGQPKSQEDRVGFFETHNLPTEDQQKAINFMAYTAKNANLLKAQAGVSSRGRKQKHGEVYSYSLSWSPEEKPDQETMKEAARSSLKKLKLDQDYQAVFIQHTDTDHAHVHVLVNLISFKDGKIANVGNDQVKLSKWAERYEREHGGIILDKRVENNKRREELKMEKERRQAERKAEREAEKAHEAAQKQKEKIANDNGQSYEQKPFEKWDRDHGNLKHKEQKIDRVQIEDLYLRSKDIAEFQALLGVEGYSLARGNRRDVVIVDMYTGKTSSLSRQISGLWKKEKEIKEGLIQKVWRGGLERRFPGFDKGSLGSIEDVRIENAQKLQAASRVDAEIDRTNQELNAADLAGKKQLPKEKERRKANENKRTEPSNERAVKGGERKDNKKKSLKPLSGGFNRPGDQSRVDQLRAKSQNQTKETSGIDKARAQSKKWHEIIDRDQEDAAKINALEGRLKKEYEFEQREKKIIALKKELAKSDTFWGRKTGTYQKLLDKLEAQENNLESTKEYIDRAVKQLREELLKSRPPSLRVANDKAGKKKTAEQEKEKSENVTHINEATTQKAKDQASKEQAFKERIRQAREQKALERGKEQGRDLDI